MKPKVLISFVLLPLATGLLSCSAGSRKVSASTETVRDIEVITAREKTMPDVFEAVGTVRARQTAVMSAEMMGYVVAVKVHEGDAVKQGQTLVVIDSAQARAGLEQAEAALSAAEHEVAAADSQLALAEATRQRYQSLYDQKSVSPQEFDEVKARAQEAAARREMARSGRARAAAALAEARTILGRTQIRAPFDGIVTARQADPGTLAVPSAPLLTVETTGRFRLEATMNENDLRYARLGQSVPVFADALGNQKLEGKIVQIVPAADPASRSFAVKIELPMNPGLRSGIFGRARFSRGDHQVLVVPRTAVLDRGQLQGVYVLDQDRIATLRYVTLGVATDDQVEVLSGLTSGETFVVSPRDRELSGKRIEVR